MNRRITRSVIVTVCILYVGMFLLTALLDANPSWRHGAINTMIPVFERFMHLPERDII